MKARIIAGAVACVFVFGGCDQLGGKIGGERPAPPSPDAVAQYYAQHRGVDDVRVSGNVVELHVKQPYQQLDRGGSLWARVGPFVYLMTPSTRSVFEDFAGVAAVRVVTYLPDGDEVARAMLRRDRLSDVLWRRTLNILGHALQEGRENPRTLEELTEWSERYTEFHYNPDYVN
ncbi:MAG: hypothetical protein ACOCVZ_03550 [Gemmatimonadota bacterium]